MTLLTSAGVLRKTGVQLVTIDHLHLVGGDARTVRRALLELEQRKLILPLQKMQKASARIAEGIDISRPAKNVELFRGPQLINICALSELERPSAKNVEEKELLRSSYGRRDAGPRPSLSAEQRREAHLFARARTRADVRGISVEEATAQLCDELGIAR